MNPLNKRYAVCSGLLWELQGDIVQPNEIGMDRELDQLGQRSPVIVPEMDEGLLSFICRDYFNVETLVSVRWRSITSHRP